MLTKNRLYLILSVLCSITSIFYVWTVLAPSINQLPYISVFFDAFIKVLSIAMIILIFYNDIKTWTLCLASLGVMYLFDYATGAKIIGTQFIGFFYHPLSLLFTPALYICTLLFMQFMRKLYIKKHDDVQPIRLTIKYAAIILALVATIASFSTYLIYEAYLDYGKKQEKLEIIKQYKAVFTKGTGEKDDPFHVSNANELSAVRHLLSDHFIQTDDIYFVDEDVEETGGFWEPIGSQNLYQHFTGSYDGNGYGIYGLKLSMDDTTQTYYPQVGLFGYTHGAVLKNIRMEQPIYERSMERRALFGFLAGEIDKSVVENCSINADSLENVGRTGGLIGSAISSRIAGCQVTITKMVVGREFADVEIDPIYADCPNVIDGNIFGIVGSMSRSYSDDKLPLDAEEGIFDCTSNISAHMVFDE